MTEQYMDARLDAELLLDFSRTVQNIDKFSQMLAELDSRFGSLEQRINSMGASLHALSNQARSQGNDLRRQIEQQINEIIAANGIVFHSFKDAPLHIKKETLQHVFSRITSELNRAVLRQIENITFQIDPKMATGIIPIGKDEFEALNKEIAKLVKEQIRNLTNNIRKSGIGVIDENVLSGLEVDIGRNTVMTIIRSIRDQILPILHNPNVITEGVTLTINARDVQQLVSKIKQNILSNLKFDVERAKTDNLQASLYNAARKIDNIVYGYAEELRRGLEKIDPRNVQVPVEEMSRRLRRYIAKDLGVDEKVFAEIFGSLRSGEVLGYELRRQIESLEKTIHNKLRANTSHLVSELRKDINQVEASVDVNLARYIIVEINKLQAQIVRKIREQIDKQFEYMKAEIETINTSPKQINRGARLRSMAQQAPRMIGGGTTIINNYIGDKKEDRDRKDISHLFGTDPYARRDAYFNRFGLQGAIINTIRHIMAGTIVGTPIMLLYQAFDAFKTSQLEMLKIMQNMALKPEYKLEDGRTDYGRIETEINELTPDLRRMSNFYAIGYDQMSQVAAIASRLTEDLTEAKKFTDVAAQIYRLDNESDLVETVAPGLEAILAQFKLSVWELDRVVTAFAVATNVTKATSDEIIKALSRSGASLRAAGLSVEEAVAINALAIQTSGLTGENIGNAMKTIAARLVLPSVVEKLESYGIEAFELDELGIKRRRSLIDILADTAELYYNKYISDEALLNLLLGEAGAYQYSKLLSFIEQMHRAGIKDDSQLTYWRIINQIEEWQKNPEFVQEMLSRTLSSPIVTLERSGVSVTNALASVIEELTPEIQNLARVITNLSEGISEHSALIADLINVLANALVGYLTFLGGRKVVEWGGYEKYFNRSTMEQRFFGGRTLTGRQIEGNIRFIESVVAGSAFMEMLNNREFYRKAMDNDLLRFYFEELSNLNDQRKEEIRRYIKDSGTQIDTLADFLMVLDESRGYSPPPKEERTVEDLHRLSSYNAYMMTQNKNASKVFAEEFIKHLEFSLSDREYFETVNRDYGGMIAKLADFDDVKRKEFEKFLLENYSTSDKQIRDFEGLNMALLEFEERNRKAAVEARRNSDAYKALAKSINEVADSTKRINKNSFQPLLDFLDDIPHKARGAASALGNVARSVVSFAMQIMGFAALGEIISSNFKWLALSPTQREIESLQMSTTTLAEEYVRYMNSNPIVRFFWDKIYAHREILEPFIAGNNFVNYDEIMNFKSDFERWLRETYGTSDINRAIEEENKRREQQAREKGLEGIYDEATLDELTRKFLTETGQLERLQKLQEKEFIEQYKKFAISEMEQNKRREAAERARKAWEARLWEEYGPGWYSFEDLKNRILEDQKLKQYEGQIKVLESVLNGVKTDSEEYMRLRIEAIQKEREAYREVMAELREYIQEIEKSMKLLEELGEDKTIDPETGEEVYTAKYQQLMDELRANKEKEENLKKEFEVQDKQLELEALRIETEFYINNAQRMFSRIMSQKQLSDTISAVLMHTESREYFDTLISNTVAAISEMRRELENLRGRSLADPDGKLRDAVLSLENQIASAELEVKNLRLQRLASWRRDYDRAIGEIEVQSLRQQVALGAVSDDNPALRAIRIRELMARRNEIEKIIARLESEKALAQSEQELEQIMRDIRDLTKQSLQAQLGIYQELKSSSGTFNLPEGVQVMTQFDYLMSKGTHRQLTIQSGDMYVTVVLPNVTSTSGTQLRDIGFELGRGLAQGRMASLRNQINASPWSYRSY